MGWWRRWWMDTLNNSQPWVQGPMESKGLWNPYLAAFNMIFELVMCNNSSSICRKSRTPTTRASGRHQWLTTQVYCHFFSLMPFSFYCQQQNFRLLITVFFCGPQISRMILISMFSPTWSMLVLNCGRYSFAFFFFFLLLCYCHSMPF